ncbi:MAG: glycosyltransferase family 87 protein [Sediminibacterium sp.]|nr:glycosyltransferase family 87 protein [Sediminibacterium sp.]
MLKKTIEILQKPLYVGIILTIITILITAQSFLLGSKTFCGDVEYTHYNNYKIFAESYFHLIENKDLYLLYPNEHFDYYKYSPTFALIMAPFAYLPEAFGLFFWNLLNVLVLFLAIWKLPFQSTKTRLFILSIILIELITSIQNSQSNALIAGLIVLAFIFLEKKQIALASLFIVLTVFIKIFGIVAFVLFLFYPDKLKAFVYTIGWTFFFLALPLLVISPNQLNFLYHNWLNLLSSDHSASDGISVAGCLQSFFDTDISKNIIVLLGAILFIIPAFQFRYYKDKIFRMLFLSSTLIWVVIFNHKAESPTFIIAMTGVAVWFCSQKRKTENVVLLILAVVLTVLSPTDIFPKGLRDDYINPFKLKALPCILIWLKIVYDLTTFGLKNNKHERTTRVLL